MNDLNIKKLLFAINCKRNRIEPEVYSIVYIPLLR